uniref:Uncharacterized protein n=1 Tax=Romanomermis culicivorax TaxID=13658 RepID=A0A915IB95_ROMCU
MYVLIRENYASSKAKFFEAMRWIKNYQIICNFFATITAIHKQNINLGGQQYFLAAHLLAVPLMTNPEFRIEYIKFKPELSLFNVLLTLLLIELLPPKFPSFKAKAEDPFSKF